MAQDDAKEAATDLARHRAAIDELDREILARLQARAGHAQTIGALKGEGGWTEVAGCPIFTNDDGAVGVAPDLGGLVSRRDAESNGNRHCRMSPEPFVERRVGIGKR